MFRKEALQSLSSPEKLDEPIRYLRPQHWFLLLTLLGAGGYFIGWSFLGRIPIRIEGHGVLVAANSLYRIQSQATGPIHKLLVKQGDCVKAGQIVAEVEPTRSKIELDTVTNQLATIEQKNLSEERIAINQKESSFAAYQRYASLRGQNLVSEAEIDQREVDYKSLLSRLEAEQNQRQQRELELKTRIANLRKELEETTIIRAIRSGCILDRQVQEGQMAQEGTVLYELNTGKTNQLDSLVFLPVRDGKRLRLQQRVQVTPTTTTPQRHGGIAGEVIAIQPLPISPEALELRLGNRALAEAIQKSTGGGNLEPLIQVTTDLRESSTTISGFDWGGGRGPDIKLSAGMMTTVRILVEERQPISYVIPVLRDLSGIY